MMYARNPLRPGMTAIAAVLALSSTQLFAQSADPSAAGASAPVLVTPPPVTVAPSDSSDISAAPETQAAPAAPMQTASTPVVHMPDGANADSSDAAPTKTMTHTKVMTTTKAPMKAPVTVTPLAAAVEKQTVAADTLTTEKTTVAPAPVAKPQPAAQTASNDDLLPIAGIAGIGLFALAGGVAFARRKKREDDIDEIEAAPEPLPETGIAAPVFVSAEPVYAMTASPAQMIDGPRTEVPASFDMSRFGRHAQAAYRGPTADNPSLSLKRRLKHASFYDQRERMAAAAQAETPAPVVAATTTRRTEHADHIVSRLRPQKQPVFQN